MGGLLQAHWRLGEAAEKGQPVAETFHHKIWKWARSWQTEAHMQISYLHKSLVIILFTKDFKISGNGFPSNTWNSDLIFSVMLFRFTINFSCLKSGSRWTDAQRSGCRSPQISGCSFLPKKTFNSPVILSRNSPGGQEKLSTFSRVTITWLGKGILGTIDYWLWNTFLTKCRDWHHFWLSAGTLYSWDREKSFWIWFIYTLEGYVLGCTYFFFEKVYFWNTLLFMFVFSLCFEHV